MFMPKSGVILLIVSVFLLQFIGAVDFVDDEKELDYLLRHTFNDWPSSISDQGIRKASPRDAEEKNKESTTSREKEELSPDFVDPQSKTRISTEGPSITHGLPQEPDFRIVDIPAGGNLGGVFTIGNGPSAGGGADDNADSFFNSFPSFGKFPISSLFNMYGRNPITRPWWEGPNVCTEKEEIVETPDVGTNNKEDATDDFGAIMSSFASTINFSSCSQKPTKYECVTKVGSPGSMKTFIVKKKCCHGYRRQLDDSRGCVKVDLNTIMETCQKLAGEEFLSIVRSTGSVERFESPNVTVFVPSDAAMKIFDSKMLELNEVDLSAVAPARKRRDTKSHSVSTRELVLNHIVPKVVELNDLSDNEKLYSEYDNSTIHINTYFMSHGLFEEDTLMTANCIPITKVDNMATNGIVHVLDGVLTPVTQPISQIIAESGKFTILSGILHKTGLDKFLDENEVYTLFAPNDAAFEKLKPELRAKFMKGDACAKNILKHHILNRGVCSTFIQGNTTTHNVDGTRILLQRQEGKDGKLVVEKVSTIVEPDVIATNGIIHVIDTVLMPESGLDATEFLSKNNLTEFQKLVDEAGLTDMLNDLSNVTLIVPTDAAIKEAAAELEKMKDDKSKMQDFIMYHTIKGEIKSCDFNNDDVLESGLPDQKLRINLYNTLPLFKTVYNRVTINCAKVTNIDDQACGSVIHEISKILTPPSQTVLEILRANKNYSTFIELISGTKLEEELAMANGSFTVLAPTNDAAEALPEKILEKLKDKEQADALLRSHVLPEVICCSGVGYQQFPFTEKVRTLGAHSMTQGHDGNGRVRFSDASVTSCDNVGTNGVVHAVNKFINVMPPRRSFNPFIGWNPLLLNF